MTATKSVDPHAGPGRRARLWAVRHGHSTANEAFERAEREGLQDAGVPGRDADVVLSTVGRRQAVALRRWWTSLPPDDGPDLVYVSPYARARQTVRIMLEQGAVPGAGTVPVRVDERLRDRETGILELLTPVAIARRHPQEAARRRRVGEVYYRPPGGSRCWMSRYGCAACCGT